MDDKQTAHAMGIDDTYRVERTLARGQGGVTEPTPATRRGNIRVARSFRGGV